MRILLIDVETAPNIVYVWGLYDQNIGINQIVASGYVMCYAAKWYGEKDVKFDSIHHSSKKKMLTGLHKLLDEADVVVSYNGISFDIPTINKEFLLAKMAPPAPYKQVDMLLVARKKFRFPSNKLDYVAKALDLGEKVKHRGQDLWTDCMAGNSEAWKTMSEYNKHDVVLLEKVYERLRPWVDGHPNVGLHTDMTKPVCRVCGGTKLHSRGYYDTDTQRYRKYQCQTCFAWSKDAVGLLTKEQRQNIRRRV